MKFLSGLGALSSVLALSMLVAFSAVGFAETRVGGTKGNDWGSPSYPNWNLPHDCGTHQQRGALFGTTGAGEERIWGYEGCDLIASGKGNDTVYTRDGENERGEIEEVHGGDGLDRCFLDPDPDGVKFSGCEYLNGRKSPYPTEKYVNTSEEGNQTERRAEVNQFLLGK